jgi:hypothetical protein
MSVKKKMVSLKMYIGSKNDERRYEGRLLGLVDHSEFNAILRSDAIAGRCVTKATMPLTNITQNKDFDGADGLNGLRMVIAVKKKGGVDCCMKKLLITEPLDYISTVKAGGKEASFTGPNSWLTIKEEEV